MDAQRVQEAKKRLADAGQTEKLPKWMPEHAGEQLIGELVARESGRSHDTEHLTFLTIKAHDGKKYSVLETTLIAKGIVSQKIEIGDGIALEYGGEVEGKSGRKYHKYTVVKV